MKTWQNGQRGKVAKGVIDDNFESLDNRIRRLSYIYEGTFNINDWYDNTIYIPYSEHKVENPDVSLYVLTNDGYEAVVGGYTVEDSNVVLLTDIAYNGRVVIR